MLMGKDQKKNYIKEIEYIKKAAKLGEMTAFTNIGVVYENGQRVEKNIQKQLNILNKLQNIVQQVKFMSTELIKASFDDQFLSILLE